MKRYKIITTNTVYSIGETDEEKQNLIDEQNSKLESLGYNLNAVYQAHYFESAFFDDRTESGTIDELIQELAIKDGVDLVQYEDGKIGFVAYYNKRVNGFEIV